MKVIFISKLVNKQWTYLPLSFGNTSITKHKHTHSISGKLGNNLLRTVLGQRFAKI